MYRYVVIPDECVTLLSFKFNLNYIQECCPNFFYTMYIIYYLFRISLQNLLSMEIKILPVLISDQLQRTSHGDYEPLSVVFQTRFSIRSCNGVLCFIFYISVKNFLDNHFFPVTDGV